MKLYWVSLLIQDTENSKPWLSAISSGYVSLEEARGMIYSGRGYYRLLSVLIFICSGVSAKAIAFIHYYLKYYIK